MFRLGVNDMLKKISGLALAASVVLTAGSASAKYDGSKVITAPNIVATMKTRPLTVQDQTVRTECGDCHMVFPPQRLTKNAWTKIMTTLSDHFGEDATLDAETAKHIEDYLLANALDKKLDFRTKLRLESWKKKGVVDPLRITETPEWTRHHIKKQHYKAMVKEVGYDGHANCIMCHRGAEHGLYEEFNGLYGDKGH